MGMDTDIKFSSSDLAGQKYVSINLTKDDDEQRQYKALLQKSLNQILDAENIIVLAGSGTSLTFNSKNIKNTKNTKVAPSMTDLWNNCYQMDKDTFDNIRSYIKYDNFAEKMDDGKTVKDIELFLSRCDTFLALEFTI